MISFSYRLTGSGWAIAELSDEKHEVRIPASYLCDALRDLVIAVESVFSAESSECLWEEEPGEVHWKFQRTGDRVTVEVLWNKERAMFDSEDDLLHFASQVTVALQKLLDEWGVDGYSKKWDYPFPVEAHHALAQLSRWSNSVAPLGIDKLHFSLVNPFRNDATGIDVDKSASHHLSQSEIAGDNLCSQHLSENLDSQ